MSVGSPICQVLFGFNDNGGDVTTGASNYPYRGTKMTPFEGGTRAAAFVSSPNPLLIPAAARGSESTAWTHAVDLLPTFTALAGADATDPPAGPLDGSATIILCSLHAYCIS
jgi:arylsulfatase A-like enzyme